MSVLAFDEIVNGLCAQGAPRAKAESVARVELRIAEDERDEYAEREAVLEKDEQREVVKLFRAFGFTVYSLSQARASKQTPGLADLYCVHRDQPIALWFETKRQQGGRLSDAQRVFQADNNRCGIRSVVGDRYTARTLLITLGLARSVDGVLEPIRRTT